MKPARVTPESQSFTKIKPPAARELDLDIARSVRMHRNFAIGVGLFVFLFLLLFGLSRRPYYETLALIYIQPMKTKGVTDIGGGFDEQRYESFLQQQLQTITRPDILQNALERPEARAWRGHGVPMQVMTTILQHSLKVDRVEQSYEVSISLAGSNPQAIADMVNAVSSAYIQGERADELAQTDQQLQILETDRQHIEDQMTADRTEQVQLSVSLGVADTTGDSGNPYDTQLTELRSELAKATAAHDAAVAEQSAIRGGEPNATVSLSAAAESIVATDPGLASYKQTTAARMSLLSSQMSGLTPQNPIYQQDQREMDRLSDDLTALEQAVRARVIKHIEQERAIDVRRTQELQSRLQQQLSSMTSVATGATPHLQRAAELAEDIKRLEVRYSDVDNAISSIELEKDTTGLVHVILPATPPLAPKTSIRRLILLLSLPFGIFMGVLAAVLKRKSNPRIFVAKDISSTFGFYPMATLPDPEDVGKDVNDEAMLRLLAGIDQIHRTEKCQTFTFTSVSARSSVEGLAESLARKMRRLGYSVATMKAEDLIDETRIGSSGTVPSMAIDEYSGNPVSPTHENFAIAKLDAYRESADFVFLEAAPILTSSVAEFTARLSDVIVLIADSGRTTRGQMRNAIDLIERLRLPGLTTVLCGLRLLNADDGFITAVESTRRRQQNVETVEA
jgi:uncharacterized protein involved in exopolysaccharide biosynthesis